MDHRSETEKPSEPTLPVGAGVSQRRRRFIQAGVVPVGLTLASRPVMAWHCNTTSAWGSAVLRNGGASVQARAAAAVLSNTECWTITNWANNSIRSQVSNTAPWMYVVARWYSGKTVTDAQAKLTVGKLFPGTLKNVSSTANVYQLLTKDPGGWGTLMVVARLNTLFAGHSVADCVLSNGQDMLLTMAAQGPNAFRPSNSTGSPWTEAEIRRYLSENYLVRT